MHLLIPMSGQGQRFKKAGYQQPKPMVPVSGTPIIERLLEKFPKDWPCTFVVADNHLETELPQFLKKLRPESKIYSIAAHTLGPGIAIEEGLRFIPKNEPVLISYCDYGMNWDAQDFLRFVRQTDCDACLISYRGFHAHYLGADAYAYSRLQGDEVVEIKEKGWFTDNRESEFASTGAYYFKSAEILQNALSYQKDHKMTQWGEFYTSLTIQAMFKINPQVRVRVFEIPAFFQWGTPEDLKAFEYWERFYTAKLAFKNPVYVNEVFLTEGQDKGFKLQTIDHLSLEERVRQSLPQASVHGRGVICSPIENEIVYNSQAWEKAMKQSPDVLLFTVKNFPNSLLDAKKNLNEDQQFIGTTWYRSRELMDLSLSELRQKGYQVHTFELEGYIDWRRADCVAEALYWHEVYYSRQLGYRSRYPGVQL